VQRFKLPKEAWPESAMMLVATEIPPYRDLAVVTQMQRDDLFAVTLRSLE
jgi:hypothetical protein